MLGTEDDVLFCSLFCGVWVVGCGMEETKRRWDARTDCRVLLKTLNRHSSSSEVIKSKRAGSGKGGVTADLVGSCEYCGALSGDAGQVGEWWASGSGLEG